jgi:hypothetical protein
LLFWGVLCCAGQEVLLQVLEQQQLLSDRVVEELTLVRPLVQLE